MGPPSSWKTPSVSPRDSSSNVGSSSKVRSSMTTLLVAVHLDVADALVDHGEVAQAEEVHLEQPERLAGRVVELGDDRAVLLAPDQRQHVEQRLPRQDDRARVHPPLPLQVLELAGGVEDLPDVGVALVETAQLGRLAVPLLAAVEHGSQRDVLAHDRRRHRLGDPLPHGVRVAEHSRRVLERLLGLDGAVGDDLGDPVLAVLLGDVAQHLAAAALVEVDVDVGHRDPLGVEEALEEQPVLERVELGDAHRVRHDRAGRRATAGADPDALALGPVDQVGGHQEVAREAHLQDHRGLEVAPLAGLRRDPVRVAACACPPRPGGGTASPRCRPRGPGTSASGRGPR